MFVLPKKLRKRAKNQDQTNRELESLSELRRDGLQEVIDYYLTRQERSVVARGLPEDTFGIEPTKGDILIFENTIITRNGHVPVCDERQLEVGS